MVAAVIAYDDLEYPENRVIADQTVVVGFRERGKEVWYELDLTDEHAELLERYRMAGREIKAHQAPQIVPDAAGVPKYQGVALWHAVGRSIRMYWKDYRAWASARGYQVHTPAGNTCYLSWQVKEYENYLSGLDRIRQDQAG
jgi:hypothetical protein